MSKTLINVPCYYESRRLANLIDQLHEAKFLSSQDITFLFLEDGSTSEEQQAVQKLLSEASLPSNLHFEFHPFKKNQGKGGVLRFGMLEGLRRGFDVIGFMDGDAATPGYEIARMTAYFENKPELDGLIGSRWLSLGRKVSRTFKRHLSGRIFATILSSLFSIPVYDCQCGAKFFRARALTTEVLRNCYNDRWLFDTQLVILLFKQGKKIEEFPVDWADQPDSKVKMLRDSWRMFWGLFQFKKYAKKHSLF